MSLIDYVTQPNYVLTICHSDRWVCRFVFHMNTDTPVIGRIMISLLQTSIVGTEISSSISSICWRGNGTSSQRSEYSLVPSVLFSWQWLVQISSVSYHEQTAIYFHSDSVPSSDLPSYISSRSGKN